MNKSKLDRIIKIALDISLGLIIVIAVAMVFGPKSPSGTIVPPPEAVKVSEKERVAFAKNIPMLQPKDVGRKLQSADGKPTLLVVYTSWCPYCRKLIPTLLSLKKEGKLKNAHVVFLSIDQDKLALADYITSYRYQSDMTPYMLDAGRHDAFMQFMGSKGSYFGGQIPHSALFDGKGKLVAELPGLHSKEQLLEAIENAQK